jgi:tetratricopeptide (TPR) repeat protein
MAAHDRRTHRTGHGPAEPRWDEALALQRAGQPERALAALARLTAAEPRLARHPELKRLSARVHADLALEREIVDDVEGAAAHLLTAIDGAPEFPDLHHRLGVARLKLRDVAGARAAFQKALEIAPAYAAPRLELAFLDARQGRLGESLALLKRLAETGAAPAARDDLARGLARLAEADWEGSEGLLRHALGLDKDPADARLRGIGQALAERRDADALALAHALVRDHPDFPDAHLALALVRRERGEWDDCAESCGRALELHPGFHQARVYLAEALSRRGQWAESDHQIAAVLAADPDHPLALALARALHRPARIAGNARVPH